MLIVDVELDDALGAEVEDALAWVLAAEVEYYLLVGVVLGILT